jgi:hypothetical protein
LLPLLPLPQLLQRQPLLQPQPGQLFLLGPWKVAADVIVALERGWMAAEIPVMAALHLKQQRAPLADL